jgi:hypothetical protein
MPSLHVVDREPLNIVFLNAVIILFDTKELILYCTTWNFSAPQMGKTN